MNPEAEVRIAYLSMEIALDPAIPTYAGGLGVLASDTLRSAADLGVPIVGVTLLYRTGYFRQRLDPSGNQIEEAEPWKPEELLESVGEPVAVTIEGRTVYVRAWRHLIEGISGHTVPIYLLDTKVPGNSPWDQTLTDSLYSGDDHYRLCQEAVLGFGAAALLPELGHTQIEHYHMNEGHSALLALALLEELREESSSAAPTEDEIEAIRRQCIFTTHTPVPAGHDQFPKELARKVLGPQRAMLLEATQCCLDDTLNMTYLALRLSSYINGVAMRHGEISHTMFPQYPVRAITNGVHAVRWAAEPFRQLFDRHIPEWRHDNLYLRYAVGIPLAEIREAHAEAKHRFLEEVRSATGVRLNENVATVGFARRATSYKRADFLFTDLQRLRRIHHQAGPFQVIYGGRAHPHDEEGKAMIRRVFEAAGALGDDIPVVYIPNYDLRWAQLFTSGVDLWLSVPHRPYEASGTSGMKAALNGVPSFSVRDGWWIEGRVEGVTGWSIGFGEDPEEHAGELASLYDKLEGIILPMYYLRPEAYAEVMRSAIALNGSFFNTQRMVSQYVLNAYFPNGMPRVHVPLAGFEARRALSGQL